MVTESRNPDSLGAEHNQKPEKRHNTEGDVQNKLCARFTRADVEGSVHISCWGWYNKKTDVVPELWRQKATSFRRAAVSGSMHIACCRIQEGRYSKEYVHSVLWNSGGQVLIAVEVWKIENSTIQQCRWCRGIWRSVFCRSPPQEDVLSLFTEFISSLIDETNHHYGGQSNLLHLCPKPSQADVTELWRINHRSVKLMDKINCHWWKCGDM